MFPRVQPVKHTEVDYLERVAREWRLSAQDGRRIIAREGVDGREHEEYHDPRSFHRWWQTSCVQKQAEHNPVYGRKRKSGRRAGACHR
mmetsp:Transcript_55618/g.132579  ORF Transcript_55618/g.132579 Transcript_55618/m.132579 type:complete len:88 (-) Transcript_55618:201-464(-)